MNGCRPLEDQELNELRTELSPRDRALLTLGVRSGFRISELLSLRVSDVTEHGDVVRHLTVQRRNMKKKVRSRTVPLHEEARSSLRDLIKSEQLSNDSWLFRSRKGFNRPISRVQAYRAIRQAADARRLSGRIGTHSMRKTFAKAIYERSGRDLMMTQKALGHASIDSTVRYLSFDSQALDNAILG
jgi:integrase